MTAQHNYSAWLGYCLMIHLSDDFCLENWLIEHFIYYVPHPPAACVFALVLVGCSRLMTRQSLSGALCAALPVGTRSALWRLNAPCSH